MSPANLHWQSLYRMQHGEHVHLPLVAAAPIWKLCQAVMMPYGMAARDPLQHCSMLVRVAGCRHEAAGGVVHQPRPGVAHTLLRRQGRGERTCDAAAHCFREAYVRFCYGRTAPELHAGLSGL